MDAIVSRTLLIFLALASAFMYARRQQWENVITRLMVAFMFIGVIIGVPLENETINSLIRWMFIIIFFIEILSWIVRLFAEDNKYGRR